MSPYALSFNIMSIIHLKQMSYLLLSCADFFSKLSFQDCYLKVRNLLEGKKWIRQGSWDAKEVRTTHIMFQMD